MQFSLTDTSDTEYAGSRETCIHALGANLHRLYPLEFANFTTFAKNTCHRIRHFHDYQTLFLILRVYWKN